MTHQLKTIVEHAMRVLESLEPDDALAVMEAIDVVHDDLIDILSQVERNQLAWREVTLAALRLVAIIEAAGDRAGVVRRADALTATLREAPSISLLPKES